MRFSHARKLVLVSNWKCGCTTIADLFAPVTEFDWRTRDQCQVLFGKPYAEMVHYPACLLRREFDRLGWRFTEYFSISSVRNPWSRAVSLYGHLLRDGFRGTFAEFVGRELPLWQSGLKRRWNTYEMWHEYGRPIIDHVVRIEHLEQDLRPVVESRWPDLQLDYSRKSNVGKHRPYQEYYTAQTRDAVASFFEYDIARFGYQFDD